MKIDWTRAAWAQFEHQHRYIAERSARAAERLIDDVTHAESLIARNPEFGRPVSPRVREWGIGREKRYVLRYVVEVLVVSIIGFWHTAQMRPPLEEMEA